MSSKKKIKFYAVFVGRTTGIFYRWDDVVISTNRFKGSKFKSFPTKESAESAIEYYKLNNQIPSSEEKKKVLSNSFISESISVDAAFSGSTKKGEYKVVHTGTGEILFQSEVYEDGTNNLVEFLALVHALAYCKKNNIKFPIYSDSITAISWVRKKNVRTELSVSEKSELIMSHVKRALKWVKENEDHNDILKWQTRNWGESKADFGRK